MFEMNAYEWIRIQPVGKWLSIEDIPYHAFWTIWQNFIEKCNVELHPTHACYKIIQKIK